MRVSLFLPVSNPSLDIREICSADFVNQPRLKVFDQSTLDFLAAVSTELMKYGHAHPELAALAYWLRAKNLSDLKEQFETRRSADHFAAPRGLAFHVAPANVDSIFFYSWAFSLLAGNLNVVRISSKSTPQVTALLQAAGAVLASPRWEDLAKRNLVLGYPRENLDVSAYLSRLSDLRVIWGGDHSIEVLRKLPAKPTTKEIVFADKRSAAAINASRYLASDAESRNALATNFYNDAYWFNQLACSSPLVVYFVGNAQDCANASEFFWDELKTVLIKKQQVDDLPLAMKKLIFTFNQALKFENLRAALPQAAAPSIMKVNQEELGNCRELCGGGVFFECRLERLDALADLARPNDQTLAHFGFTADELNSLASKINGQGFDRLVPIGRALQFTPVWDGYSLLHELTKTVLVTA